MPRVAAVQADIEAPSVEQNIQPQYGPPGPPIPRSGREYIVWLIHHWSAYYEYTDTAKAEAIVSCEGGFNDPHICNKQYGCRAGQGHAQFIPSTWANMENAIGVKDVFDSSDNIQGLIYLLKTSGDQHWGTLTTEWGSARCWIPKLKM